MSRFFTLVYFLRVVRFMYVLRISLLPRERVHKRRLKEVVKEFSLMCRGLHGTAYAAATY